MFKRFLLFLFSVKRSLVICFMVISFSLMAFGPVTKDANSGKCSLLVAMNDQQAATTKLQHLMSFHFGDGAFTGTEKLVSVKTMKEDGKNTSYIRFDLGYNY